MRHNGRLALITGAASGISRATAKKFAAEGARLVLFDLAAGVEQTADDIVAGGGAARGFQVDIADPDAVEAAIREAVGALGAIDILVNGAGIVDHIAPIAKMKPEKWLRELQVNLGGPFNTTRVLAPMMAEAGWGRIVNISSVAARGGLILQAAYAASKKGLLGLTQNTTLEFARFGVTCNAVLPGLIGTEKVQAMPPAILDAGTLAAPARRIGEMEEVAELISFLCSDGAGFINGAEIDISGGGHLNTLSLGSQKENKRG